MDIHPLTSDAYNLFHQGTLALARAEQQGFRLDMEYAESKKKQLTKKIEILENKLKDTDFYRRWVRSIGEKQPNIYSNTQLSHYLYGTLKLHVVATTSNGNGATDEEALTGLGIPELNDLLQIRKLKKVRDTYLEAFAREAVDGFIHPSYNLHLVKTFRSSSDKPNFQNIPKRDEESMTICRKALYPRLGHQLLEADYSNLEVRIAACYHKDPTMMKYITDPTTDMHSDMARQLFLLDSFDKKIPSHKELRSAAKGGFVFAQFYGDYYKPCAVNLACSWGKLPKTGKWKKGQGISMVEGTLGDHFISHGIRSLEQFTEHVKNIEADFWGVRFKEYARWKEQHYAQYQKTGYVDLKTGFRCYGPMSRNDVSNYPVQGAAFHCLLKSFILLDEVMVRERWDTRLIGQIHDSMIFDVHPDELDHVVKTIREVTCERLKQEWKWINVPLDVEIDLADVDQSWASLKSYK